jgi:hypothetical protein
MYGTMKCNKIIAYNLFTKLTLAIVVKEMC